MLLAAVLATLTIRALPFVGLEHLRTPVALLFASLAGLWSLYVIWQEVGGMQNVRAVLERIRVAKSF
jgi:hypothetical protein